MASMVGRIGLEYHVLTSEERTDAEKKAAELDARVAALDAQAQPIIIKDRRRAEMIFGAFKKYAEKIGLADKVRISVEKNTTGICNELEFDHAEWDMDGLELDGSQADEVRDQLDRIDDCFYTHKNGLYFWPLDDEYRRLHRDMLAETIIEPVSVGGPREFAAVYVVDWSSPVLKRLELDQVLGGMNVTDSEIPRESVFADSARKRMLEDAVAKGVDVYVAYNFSRRLPLDEVVDYVKEVLNDSSFSHEMRWNLWKAVDFDDAAIEGLKSIRQAQLRGLRYSRCPVRIEEVGFMYQIVELLRKLGRKKTQTGGGTAAA